MSVGKKTDLAQLPFKTVAYYLRSLCLCYYFRSCVQSFTARCRSCGRPKQTGAHTSSASSVASIKHSLSKWGYNGTITSLWAILNDEVST